MDRLGVDGRGKFRVIRFFCKKPVPEPSAKTLKWLAVSKVKPTPWHRFKLKTL